MKTTKKTLATIAANFAIFCTLIVSIEIISQVIYFIKMKEIFFRAEVHKGHSAYSKAFEIHPYLAGRLKKSVEIQRNNYTIVKTTSLHTRWTGGSQEDDKLIRIAILGGSTAFGTGVSDENSWPALLQQKLGKGFSVINYGVPGFSTTEAIIQMALIVPEKRPHMVIFYEGWNDIRNYHEAGLGADYYGHGMRQYGHLGVYFQGNNPSFATSWLIDEIKSSIKKPLENSTLSFATADPFVDKIYVRNLRTLRALAKNIDAFAMFIPQLLNYSRYSGEEGANSWSRHIKNSAMPSLMDKFNAHMDGLCIEKDSACVVLAKITAEKWLPNDFVDYGHFSKKGGLKFSEIIAQTIRRNYASVP